MNWLWFLPLFSFLLLEVGALLSRTDKWEPATYWIRKLLMLRNKWTPLYWLGVGFWLWLGVHFFVDA